MRSPWSCTARPPPDTRAGCNPVPPDDKIGGWLNRLIAWWWDPNTGYAIAERSGVLRWFVRVNDELVWADTPEELSDHKIPPRSLTFISSKVEDNYVLMEKDPGYKIKLQSLTTVERERLLHGNWLIRPEAGLVFDRSWFQTLKECPNDIRRWGGCPGRC